MNDLFFIPGINYTAAQAVEISMAVNFFIPSPLPPFAPPLRPCQQRINARLFILGRRHKSVESFFSAFFETLIVLPVQARIVFLFLKAGRSAHPSVERASSKVKGKRISTQ